MRQIYVLLIVLLALAGCGGGRYGEMRQRLEALNALNRADSVLTVKDRDEAQTLTDYFDSHGRPNDQMLAHYLLGRCYADMREAPMALHCYQEAITRADTLSPDCDFAQLCRVYGQSADIFYQQGLYQNMLDYEDLSMEYGWKSGDTLAALRSYAMKALAYDQLQVKDSAIHVYTDAIKQMKAYNNKVAAGFSFSVARLLTEKGYFDRAADCFKEYEHHSGYFDSNGDIVAGREIYYYYKGLYHLKIHQFDSAEYYFRKELRTGKDFNNQNAASYGLAQLFKQKHLTDSSAKYFESSYAMNDSAFAHKTTHEVEQAKAMYDYSRQREIAKDEKERADRQSIWLLFLMVCTLAILLVAGIVCFLLYLQREKRRKAELQYKEVQEKYKKIQSELSDLRENGADTEKLISEKDTEVANLQAELAKHEYLWKTLSGQATKEEIALLKENDKYNSIIRKSDSGKVFSSEDWVMVDSLLKEMFPHFHHFITIKKASLGDFEYYVCLLIRLYIPVKSCATIIGIDESYITKIRKQLDMKLFQGDGNSKNFDKLLRSVGKLDTILDV